MVKLLSVESRKYTHVHECQWPLEAIDIHHVIVRKSGARSLVVFLFITMLLAHALCLFLVENKSVGGIIWSFPLSGILFLLLVWKPVDKESVIIMPAFGVQLETHYLRGRVVRRFVPIDKILKPVLIECVTPISCYWRLSLLVRDEDLTLVFKELRPPMKMLVPIWKALCAAIDNDVTTGSVNN